MEEIVYKDGLRKASLDYHASPRKGKIEVNSTKPCITQYDLSLAYTPGVAEPCKEIQRNPGEARKYTAKGNLVAVISNGTAVLGLGNIGALAGKPVMEGKGVLFKRFADIDVFDIEIDSENPEKIIEAVKLISPTFGGINLEDIKAPECFLIEERLKKELDIPVFHDDQHGTAIISGAALINALELVGKDIKDVRVVFSGAGASGIACANFYVSLGVKIENILMVDSKGVLYEGRGDESINKYKSKFFRHTSCRDLADAVKDADIFCGLSKAGIFTKAMAKTMAVKPIILAMANPDPEISYPDAREARPDAIIATGRSDYPNQVNNVLGFPFIFRGALDVEAHSINEEMKLAVAHALAKLAKEEVPEYVLRAYNEQHLSFGPEYIIPTPFDHRVLISAATAVAEAAMRTGVARRHIDLDKYREELIERLDPSRDIMRKFHIMARQEPKKIVFPEGTHPKILKAANEIVRLGIARPVLLAKDRLELLEDFKKRDLNPEGIQIMEPKNSGFMDNYTDSYYSMTQRKGISVGRARLDLKNYFYFAMMMLKMGQADALLGGVSVYYTRVLNPALQIIGKRNNRNTVAGMYMLLHENKMHFLADCAVNINPSTEELVDIALLAVEEMKRFNMTPQVAMLSFSNFGSVQVSETKKIVDAVDYLHRNHPNLIVDGPVQADMALDPFNMQQHFPFSKIKKRPNLFIFPNLDAGNISLKLLTKFSHAHCTGPIIMGMAKPVHILARSSEVNQIIDIAAIATVDAQVMF